jgi:hypothetical protein
MLYRARQTIAGCPVSRSAALQICLGLMLLALALKQAFWQVFWAVRAVDGFSTAARMLTTTWVATAINSVAIVLGACACVLAARPLYGAYALPIVVGALIITTAATGVMVMR